jgi:predicted alpha/beta-hydrolase family hydrolase
LTIYLAHGASGSPASMKPWIAALKKRGLDARAIALPVGKAERAIPAYRQQLKGSAAKIVTDAVIGGHSFGGRVASMLAAELPVAGLVLLSYPLHRPGHPEQLRVEHWPRIDCPTLMLSGESDPFARIDLLRAETQALDNAELVTYPGVGHGLLRVIEDAADRIAEFMNRLAPAS